jgi:hypothetical protein
LKNVLLALILALLLIAPASFAQVPEGNSAEEQAISVVPKEEQATKEDVLALMDVLQSRRQAVAAIDMTKEQILKGMHLSFLQDHPSASPEVLKKLDATMDGVWKVINVDDILQVTVPIYQKYLSHEDAISLISFYSSPAGQNYLTRMPALIKESGEAGGKLMTGHLAEVEKEAKLKFVAFQEYIAAHPEQLGAPAESNSSEKP